MNRSYLAIGARTPSIALISNLTMRRSSKGKTRSVEEFDQVHGRHAEFHFLKDKKKKNCADISFRGIA
jgi:hypothetical protein